MHYISRHINKIFFLSRQQQRKELLLISAHILRNLLLQMVLFLTFANQENCAISIMFLTERTINTDLLKLESVVDGMKITDKSEFQCDVCILGKMTQSFNRQSDIGATKPLELVHCDLSGPITPVARSGFRYMYAASFVDDYSRACTVYFLRQKRDGIHATEKFVADCAPIAEVKRLR